MNSLRGALYEKVNLSFFWVAALVTFAFGCSKDPALNHPIFDPAQIKSISQFNSCCGHAYPDGSGTSQKHYFYAVSALQGTADQVSVSSPCDGFIDSVEQDQAGCKA